MMEDLSENGRQLFEGLKAAHPKVELHNGHYAVVRTRSLTYFVTELNSGTVTIPESLNNLNCFGRDHIRVCQYGGVYGIMDCEGNVVLPCRFPRIQDDMNEMYPYSRVGELGTLINLRGETVIDGVYHISPVYRKTLGVTDVCCIYVRDRKDGPERRVFLDAEGDGRIILEDGDVPTRMLSSSNTLKLPQVKSSPTPSDD